MPVSPPNAALTSTHRPSKSTRAIAMGLSSNTARKRRSDSVNTACACADAVTSRNSTCTAGSSRVGDGSRAEFDGELSLPPSCRTTAVCARSGGPPARTPSINRRVDPTSVGRDERGDGQALNVGGRRCPCQGGCLRVRVGNRTVGTEHHDGDRRLLDQGPPPPLGLLVGRTRRGEFGDVSRHPTDPDDLPGVVDQRELGRSVCVR